MREQTRAQLQCPLPPICLLHGSLLSISSFFFLLLSGVVLQGRGTGSLFKGYFTLSPQTRLSSCTIYGYSVTSTNVCVLDLLILVRPSDPGLGAPWEYPLKVPAYGQQSIRCKANHLSGVLRQRSKLVQIYTLDPLYRYRNRLRWTK